MPVDPVGGREAEIKAVAAAFNETAAYWFIHAAEGKPHAEEHIAGIAVDVLHPLRSSGSAAQNQEEEGLSIHVDVCPDCCEPTSYHPMDPPMQCTHDRERYVPVRFVEARSPQDKDHETWDEDQEAALLWQAREALRYTREYVGEDTLPAIEGWSWYDATVAIDRFLAARSPQDEDHE
jgi:hypothetical protein